MPSIDEELEDFPKSEIWRLQTDGCQATQGPNNFREKFYKGMDAGFKFLNENIGAEITPELIEGIYKSTFQFEDDYESDAILQKGYSEVYGAFEIFLPLEGLESAAGVSEHGLDELIEALREAQNRKALGLRPQYELIIETASNTFPILFNPNDHKTVEACKAALLIHLRHASGSKDLYKGEKKADEHLTKIELASNKAKREEILGWVQEDIDSYQKELSEAKSIQALEAHQQAEINAINRFVRKLHQCHYFPDGNGRTFVFLLANLLSIQNGLGMKITQNPAHYAAFSSQELLIETTHDLQHFNQYKITAAKNYLIGLKAVDINDEVQAVRTNLMANLSMDPLIAMAQIDELYRQIHANRLVVPETYAPDKNGFFYFLSAKTPLEVKQAHAQVLGLLEEAYLEKLGMLVENVSLVPIEQRIGHGSEETPAKVLKDMVDRHHISKVVLEAAVITHIKNYNEAAIERPQISSASIGSSAHF